jgi:hypothetical protein
MHPEQFLPHQKLPTLWAPYSYEATMISVFKTTMTTFNQNGWNFIQMDEILQMKEKCSKG